MKKTEVINELNRYLKTPTITFDNGLMQTDNDSALGFVSELHNMEINKGVVERRKGNRFISVPDITNKFIFMKELTVNGVHFILGINEHGEVVAFLDMWVEVQFSIYKKGLFHLSENLGDGFKLKFKRGNKFWLIEDNKYYKIINDFGDACRINKHGYIQFMDISETYDDYNETNNYIPKKKLDELRYNHPSIAGLFLEITDVTHLNPPKNVRLIRDETKDTPEIKGDVRFANVNEAGYRGLWSESIFFSNWQSGYFSKYNALFVQPAEYRLNKEITSTTGGKISGIGEITSEPRVMDAIWNTSSDSATWGDNTLYSEKYKFRKNWNHGQPDSITFTSDVFFSPASKQLQIYTSRSSVSGDIYLNDINDILFQLKNVKFLTLEEDVTGKSFLGDDTDYKKFDGIELFGRALLKTDNQTIPRDYDNLTVGATSALLTTAADNTENKVIFTLALSDEEVEKITKAVGGNWKTCVVKDSTGEVVIIADAIGTAQIRAYGEGRAKTKVSTVFEIKKNVDFMTEKMVLLSEQGMNLWENHYSNSEFTLKDIVRTISTDSVFISKDPGDVGFLLKERDITENKDSGFAVWNDGFIKAESQEFFQEEGEICNPHYIIEDNQIKPASYISPSITGRVCNQTPAKLEKRHVPVVSMRDTKLTRRYHNLNFLEETIKQPQQVANSSGVVFVVQGKRVWIGNQDSLILHTYRDIDFSVEHMEPLYNGVLLATNKGLKTLSNKGELNTVNTSKINSDRFKAMTLGASGVFGITNSEEVVFVHMVFNGDSKPYAEAQSLSDAIYTVQWGDRPKMEYVGDTLWIGRKHDVWGFKEGGWKAKQVFAQTINNLTQLNGELVIAFYGKTIRTDIVEAN